MTISEWLDAAVEQFTRADIPSARLDAELILCHMLGVDRTWLIAHGDESLARAALSHTGGIHPGGVAAYGEKLVLNRLRRQPMAYLLGSKEFYGRDFLVTKDVLIPRPESESLIELAKKHHFSGHLLDVGTGSGALAITLALELPQANITASDISPEALDVARKNAKKHRASTISFVESDLLEAFVPSANTFDAIIANLPYVDRKWERSPETKYEPALALFAADEGLALIKQLLEQAPAVVSGTGYLLLEADPVQHDEIVRCAEMNGFSNVEAQDYALLLQRHPTS